MKRKPLLGLLALLSALAAPLRADDGWRLVRDKDGFQFSARHVPFSKVDEVRAVATMDLPIDGLLAILVDVEHYPANMPPTSVARRIRGGGDDAIYYVELKPPMSSRRYYCVRYVVQRPEPFVRRVEWAIANDHCPTPGASMMRMDDNAGAWTLTALGPGRTRVTYQAHVDPGGAIPASFVNWGTPGAIHDLFASLRRSTQRSLVVSARN